MNHIKRTAALLLALLLIFSLSVTAVAASPYATAKNSGVRHEVCTALDGTTAAAYYTGTYAYDTLSGLGKTELLASLRTLMITTHKKQTSYSDCRDMSVNTDCQGGDGKIVLLYTSSVVTRNDFIGSGSIGPTESGSELWEFGYNLRSDCWNKGYTTEAAKAMIQFAYETFGVRDFGANHAIENPASGKVMEHCGLRFDHYTEYSTFDKSETFPAKAYRMHIE